MEKTNETNRPVYAVKRGLIDASIWRNETKSGVRHNVTLRRRYSKQDGERVTWHSTDSFGREDLPTLRELIDEAMSWLETSTA